METTNLKFYLTWSIDTEGHERGLAVIAHDKNEATEVVLRQYAPLKAVAVHEASETTKACEKLLEAMYEAQCKKLGGAK